MKTRAKLEIPPIGLMLIGAGMYLFGLRMGDALDTSVWLFLSSVALIVLCVYGIGRSRRGRREAIPYIVALLAIVITLAVAAQMWQPALLDPIKDGVTRSIAPLVMVMMVSLWSASSMRPRKSRGEAPSSKSGPTLEDQLFKEGG